MTVGLLVIAVGVLGLLGDRAAPAGFGVVRLSTSGSAAALGTTALPDGTVQERKDPAVAGSRRSPTAGAARDEATAPVELDIPVVGVRARVEAVGSVHGRLVVPDDPRVLGWWSGGARPGDAAGSVVIDGHVDVASRGPGALIRVDGLTGGDRVILTLATRLRLTYRVIGRRVYRKAAGLPADLFALTGTPRLVLITCGGPFDPVSRTYRDNVAVFAAPVA